MLYRMAQSTRTRMIEAAIDLFHVHGVNATSVDQILARSGTGKGQFTHYFKNKEGLVQAAIQFLDEVIRNEQAPTGYHVRTWREFDDWFQRYIDFQKATQYERSCPLTTIGNDLSNEQEQPRRDIRNFLQWSRGQLARFFAERRAAGELVAAADPDQLADLCLSVMQGGMLLTKVNRESDIFENAATQVRAYVRSLRPARKQKV
jgi:TetR/AcrR family transcriptional regulator, transcriptional repressor for nem operon